MSRKAFTNSSTFQNTPVLLTGKIKALLMKRQICIIFFKLSRDLSC